MIKSYCHHSSKLKGLRGQVGQYIPTYNSLIVSYVDNIWCYGNKLQSVFFTLSDMILNESQNTFQKLNSYISNSQNQNIKSKRKHYYTWMAAYSKINVNKRDDRHWGRQTQSYIKEVIKRKFKNKQSQKRNKTKTKIKPSIFTQK